jgi:hypothetical protein
MENNNQGRRPEQEEVSTKFFAGAFCGMLIIIIILAILNYM